MDPIALFIIGIGLPFAIGGYLLTRSYCKASTPRSTGRYSHRASLMNSTEEDLRAASDAAMVASSIVAGTVIHS